MHKSKDHVFYVEFNPYAGGTVAYNPVTVKTGSGDVVFSTFHGNPLRGMQARFETDDGAVAESIRSCPEFGKTVFELLAS